MARLRVIKNMIDKKCNVARRVGDEFVVTDLKRVKELLDNKVVEEIKEQSDKQVTLYRYVAFLYVQKLMT